MKKALCDRAGVTDVDLVNPFSGLNQKKSGRVGTVRRDLKVIRTNRNRKRSDDEKVGAWDGGGRSVHRLTC